MLTRKLFDFTICAQIRAIFMKNKDFEGKRRVLLIFALGYTFRFAGS